MVKIISIKSKSIKMKYAYEAYTSTNKIKIYMLKTIKYLNKLSKRNN